MGDEIRTKPLNNISRVMEGIRRDLIKKYSGNLSSL
jgi:hypothetical protein